MNKFLFSFIVFFALCVTLSGQNRVIQIDQEIEDLTLQDAILEQSRVFISIENGRRNIVNLEQIGKNQISSNVKGNYNEIAISQIGQQNFLNVNQTGNRNFVSNRTFRSDFNSISLTQNGNNNTINQFLRNVDGSNYEIQQLGTNLVLNHSIENVFQDAIQIVMQGNGMEITIETIK